MVVSSLRGLAVDRDFFVPLCTSLPALYLVHNDLAGAAATLTALASAAREGVLPVSATDPRPDAFANLWFIRAAHLFATADRATGGAHAGLVNELLLPLTKTILQQFIATAVGGIRMDDGGLLLPPEGIPGSLRLNALWYSALESCAVDFKQQNDRVADHFERLAGRFRRSFMKTFWCEAHGRVCPPEARVLPDHGPLPDPEQLLLAFLPESPIARTKQRQLLQMFRNTSLGQVGLRFEHPVHGVVESPLYRAWLLLGMIETSEGPVPTEAAAIAEPLQALRSQAHTSGLPALYRDGQPLPDQPADPVTTAEVLGASSALKA